MHAGAACTLGEQSRKRGEGLPRLLAAWAVPSFLSTVTSDCPPRGGPSPESAAVCGLGRWEAGWVSVSVSSLRVCGNVLSWGPRLLDSSRLLQFLFKGNSAFGPLRNAQAWAQAAGSPPPRGGVGDLRRERPEQALGVTQTHAAAVAQSHWARG